MGSVDWGIERAAASAGARSHFGLFGVEVVMNDIILLNSHGDKL